jgi:hypothetical protein
MPAPAPSGAVGGAKPPGASGPPRGGGRSWPRSAQSLFRPPGGGGGRGEREGRRGDLTSGREVLSSRELSGGCQARQVRGALPRRTPPRPGRPRTPPEAAWAGESPGEVSAGRRRGGEGGGGARTTWKVSFRGRAGEGASSWRVRWWVCEPGCVCESRLRRTGGGRRGPRSGPLGGAHFPRIPPWETGRRCPGAGERAGGGFVWFQKCTLLTAGRAPPPAAEPGRGPQRVTAGGGGREKGRERGGLGSPREFPFPLEQRKVCL